MFMKYALDVTHCVPTVYLVVCQKLFSHATLLKQNIIEFTASIK
jgi:hypothetical protein